MKISFTFRQGFIGGAIIAFGLGAYLFWLWQPNHQVQLHARHFVQAVEEHNWTAVQNAIAPDYADDWGDNGERLLERVREGLRFTRNMRIKAVSPNTSVQGLRGSWIARMEIEGSDSEIMAEIKERINSLTTPFELQWRRQSGKPWDWKLVHVSNRELRIHRD